MCSIQKFKLQSPNLPRSESNTSEGEVTFVAGRFGDKENGRDDPGNIS